MASPEPWKPQTRSLFPLAMSSVHYNSLVQDVSDSRDAAIFHGGADRQRKCKHAKAARLCDLSLARARTNSGLGKVYSWTSTGRVTLF